MKFINGKKVLGKRNLKAALLDKIVSNQKINNILEIGRGNSSTKVIINTLIYKKKGFCLSLENDPFYYKYVLSKVPDDQYGKVKLSDLIWDQNGLHYEYSLDKDAKYDFVFIDGPGLQEKSKDNPYKIDLAKAKELCKQFMSRKDVCLNPDYIHGRACRMFMLDYVMTATHQDTIIMVDSSKTDVLYYY